MHKLIIGFLLLFSFVSNAQTPAETYIDSLSYAFFNQYDYSELKQLGKESLKQGIDFFYLRTRLGIVAFREANYEAAWHHFEKAEKMQSGDNVVLEYLYWSYVYTGQNDKANALYEKYQSLVQSILPGIANKQQSEIEIGTLQTQNQKNYFDQVLRKTGDAYAGGSFFSSMHYLRLYHEQRFKHNWRIFAGAGMYQVQSFSNVWTENQFPPPDSFSLSQSDPNVQLNFGLSKLFSKGIRASFSASYYHERFTSNGQNTQQSLLSNNYYGVAAAISKRFKSFEPVVLVSVFDVDAADRIQVEAGITLFPFKKNNFFSFSSIGYANNQFTQTSGLIALQKLGYHFNKSTMVQTSFLYGELDNYMGNLGFVTLNTFDPVDWIGSVQAEFKKGKLTWLPGYQLQSRSSFYSQSQSLNNIEDYSNTEYSYFSHLIYLTLRYTP